ncbi:34472_t:CDS:10, partial [Gigaspora margarita]
SANKNWADQLVKQSSYRVKISHAYQDQNPVYIKLKVPKITIDINELSLVLLIPGYLIFLFFGGVYCILKLCWNSIKQIILYEWAQFGQDSSFTNITQSPLIFESQSSLLQYINNTTTLQYKDEVSLPWLLGFTNTENVKWLRGYIRNHFINIFDIEKQFYKDEQEISHLIKLGKRIANSNDNKVSKKRASQLKNESWETTQQIVQGLGQKLKDTTSELQKTRKKLYRSQKKVLTLQELLENESDTSSDDDSDSNDEIQETMTEDQEFQELIQSLILKGKLESSLFIITCYLCQAKIFYGNEMAGIEFSDIVAAAGLVGRVNHEEWSTMLCLCGITCQSEKSQYFQKQEKFFNRIINAAEDSTNNALCTACEEVSSKENEILEIGFDCAWSKVREAPQAIEKPHVYKRNEKEVIVNEGNYNSSSRQMEHVNLISIISKITPTLYKYNIILDVGVDGDLNTNKTLCKEKIVHKIFADLKHKSKILRNKIVNQERWKRFEQPIMDFYTRSVYAAIARIQNPDIILPTDNDLYIIQSETSDPNLIGYTQNQANALKEFLKKYTKLPQKQSLITTIRTSMNEAFNRVKLNYTDKKVDFTKSFSAWHGLAVLHNNNGLLEMLEVVRWAGNLLEFSEQDQINIGKIWKQREVKRNCNIAEINKQNVLRNKKIAETKKQMEEFDFSKDLIPYRITTKDNIINQEFQPSFANLIPDFDGFIHCEGCKCFPKQSPKGGLCHLYYFYNEHGLASYIINPKFHNIYSNQETVIPIELIDSIVKDFFKFNNYRELQQESTRKTLIFSIVSILTKALTVVFMPLKAVMECQLHELVKMGIPAAKLYAASDQSLEEQEKIFGEIAVGITKVLWITPEKFIESPRFHKFLCNVSQTREKKNLIKNIYRPAWTKLEKIKDEFSSSPILLLTATCSYEGATQLATILKRPNLKDIIEIVYKYIEQTNNGQAIIYSSTPNKCIDIFNGLKEYINSNQLGIYHGKMHSIDQKRILRLWNNQELKYIVATNAFGMGVHTPDIRIIIHTTFLLSPTNFVQEVGQAGRDGKQAESVVLYSRADIRELLMIVSEKLLKFTNDPTTQIMNFERDDIVDVFMKAKNKNAKEKNLISLWENKSDNAKSKEKTLIRTRNICLHTIDRLYIEGLLVQNVVIKPIRSGSLTIVYSLSISGIAPEARQKILENL